ncbi:MAG: putative ABC transporter permease [Clostridia bacterium]|nr:putative ABC transporter permease [Clostridia bacterium]
MSKKNKNKTYINKEKQEEKNSIQTSKVKICGVSLWRIIGYFIIYSFLGYLIEVLYGLITKGVIESRQSFLYGPFCGIYGLGAVLMVLPFKKHKKSNNIQMFIGSAIIGCSVEYFISWFGETFMHIKWWDYSNYFLNINGRICLYFGIFWGVLGIWLVKKLNPRVDATIDRWKRKIPNMKRKTAVSIVALFLLIDCLVTIVALDYYKIRVVVENNVSVEQYEYYKKRYEEIYSNEKRRRFIETCWSNEIMIKTFPNIKVRDKSGKNVYLNSFYPEIQNYYYKVFDNEVNNLTSGNL